MLPNSQTSPLRPWVEETRSFPQSIRTKVPSLLTTPAWRLTFSDGVDSTELSTLSFELNFCHESVEPVFQLTSTVPSGEDKAMGHFPRATLISFGALSLAPIRA